MRKPKAGRTDGCKDERKDKQTERQTDGHVLHLKYEEIFEKIKSGKKENCQDYFYMQR
jgi:hypothetical protein